MEVVILCGGKGTRIRGVSEDLPKPLIPVGGRPLLWHIMKGYANAGFRRFVLCLGYKSWVIKRYFLDFMLSSADMTVRLNAPDAVQLHRASAEDWEVTLVETGEDTMTGCRVKRVAEYISGNDFMLTYGDGLADVALPALLAFHKSHGKVGTVTVVHPPGPGRFGEVDLAGPAVAEFREKPLAASQWINGGFFVFQRAFLDRLTNDPNLILERAPLSGLCQDGELMAYRHDGFWHCVDTVRDHEHVSALWAEGAAPWLATPAPAARAA